MFTVAALVVASVVVFGLNEWANGDSEATTALAIERIAVIGAAFYLAGQLFRRSAQLNIQASEFQRAAIAMAVTDGLAELIGGDDNAKVRADFRRSVYEHHLKGASSPSDTHSAGDTDSVLKLVEAINKLRGGA